EGIDSPSARGRACAIAEGPVAVAVVGGALVLVHEDFVGLADLLEFFLGLLVVGILVGVILHGETAVGLLDLARLGVPRHFEDFVVAALLHGLTPKRRNRSIRRHWRRAGRGLSAGSPGGWCRRCVPRGCCRGPLV